MTRITMPVYALARSDNRGVLKAEFHYQSPITGQSTTTAMITLESAGRLVIRSGYEWDFGTGAVDTPAMVYGSLAHDALYDLMRRGLLPWQYRRHVDEWFRHLLRDAGVGWFRRQYVYAAVRIGYPVFRAVMSLFGR